MELVDTHCHIHFDDYPLAAAAVLGSAAEAGVNRIICVGTSLADSRRAVEFATSRPNVWASVGAHPHDASQFLADKRAAATLAGLLAGPKVVAIGEIGLDFYRKEANRTDQEKALRLQIESSFEAGLPYIFHVRDAWRDFWRIFDDYKIKRAVVHSFTAGTKSLDDALSRGLYIGLNGIMTFSRDHAQLEAAKKAPLDSLVLETDAPFLTPKPFNGDVCQPKHIRAVAEFLAELRGETLAELARATTANAVKLFGLEK